MDFSFNFMLKMAVRSISDVVNEAGFFFCRSFSGNFRLTKVNVSVYSVYTPLHTCNMCHSGNLDHFVNNAVSF